MNKTIRWGVVGAGVIARRFVRDIALCSDSSLSAIASRSLSKAEDLRDHAGMSESECACYQGYEALLAAPDIDAVYIALPTVLHAQATLAAIAAGKPVLCEKPLALNAAEAREIATAARNASVPVMEAMWTRALPNIIETRQMLRDGAIGAPLHFNATLGFPVDDAPHKSVAEPALGGGVVRDLGVYPLSLAQYFLGPLSFVASELRLSARGTDRDMIAVLRGGEDGSCLVSISASHGGQLSNRLEITGTEGRLAIDAPFLSGFGGRHLRYAPVLENGLGRDRGAESVDARHEPLTSGGQRGPSFKEKLKHSYSGRLLRRFLRDHVFLEGERLGKVYAGTGLQFQIDEFTRMLHKGERDCHLMPLSDSVEVAEILGQITGSSPTDSSETPAPPDEMTLQSRSHM